MHRGQIICSIVDTKGLDDKALFDVDLRDLTEMIQGRGVGPVERGRCGAAIATLAAFRIPWADLLSVVVKIGAYRDRESLGRVARARAEALDRDKNGFHMFHLIITHADQFEKNLLEALQREFDEEDKQYRESDRKQDPNVEEQRRLRREDALRRAEAEKQEAVRTILKAVFEISSVPKHHYSIVSNFTDESPVEKGMWEHQPAIEQASLQAAYKPLADNVLFETQPDVHDSSFFRRALAGVALLLLVLLVVFLIVIFVRWVNVRFTSTGARVLIESLAKK